MRAFSAAGMALLGLVAAACALLLVGRVPRREVHPACAAVSFALYALLMAAALAARLQFIYTLAMAVPLTTLFVWAGRRIPLYEAFYLACLFFLCYDLSSLLVCNILMEALFGGPSGLGQFGRDAFLVGASAAVLLGTTWALRRWFISDMYILPPIQTLLIVVPMVPYAYVRSGLYITAFNGGVPSQYTGEIVLLVMSFVPAFVQMLANRVLLGAQTRKNDVLQMQAMLTAQHQQYLIKREAIDQVNRYYHDMKHFAALLGRPDAAALPANAPDGSAPDGSAPSAARFERELATYSPFVETGCPIVDVLVGEKVQYCTEHGIRIVPFMDARGLVGMDPLELCTLFGNAFDNAIEAVEVLDDPDLREIKAKLAQRGDYAVFVIENPCIAEGRPSTGRVDVAAPSHVHHGYGIPNMRRVVESHDGSLTLEREDGMFRLTVVLKVPGGVTPA